MSSPFNPYAEQHKNANGPGDKRPTAMQVLQDNNLIQAWHDKVVLITGASSGIGIETARAMYATGARVFVMVRDAQKMQAIVTDIIAQVKEGTGHIEIIELDLDSLDSVRSAAKQFLEKSTQLNVLINNAGIMACPPSTTVDGFERQFAVNYLSHFTLTMLLLPTMLSSSSPSFNSRVIWVSSTAHRFGAESFDFSTVGHLDTTNSNNKNNINNYNPETTYGHSKLAMVWASNHLDRKYGSRGVHSLAVHPGGIASNLMKYTSADKVAAWMEDKELFRSIKSPEQGAATQVWAAAAPVWEGEKGGLYLSDVSVAEPCLKENVNSVHDIGYGPFAYDPDKEERLWKMSLKMAGLEDI